MKTKEWLRLAKEDSVTANNYIIDLIKLLEQKLPEGDITNNDINVKDIYDEMRNIAKTKAKDGSYCMNDSEALDISIECLGLKKISKKEIKDISFEELL